MKDEAQIQITDIHFYEGGSIEASGTVESEPVQCEIQGRDFERLLKKGFDYLDDDNNYTGRMDDFGGLHLLAKLEGAVVWHRFNLNGTIKQLLIEEYHKQIS